MTVKELISLLEEIPGETKIIIAKDQEGNGFSDLLGWGWLLYHDGEAVNVDEPDEIDEDAEKVLCLWP